MTSRASVAPLAPTIVALARALLQAPDRSLHAGLRAGTHEPLRVYHDLLRLMFRGLFWLSVEEERGERADDRPPPTPPSLRSGGEHRRTSASVGLDANTDGGRRTADTERGKRWSCSQSVRLAQRFDDAPLLSEAKGGSGGACRPPARPLSLLADLDSLASVQVDEPALLALLATLRTEPLDAAGFIALGESLEGLLAQRPSFDLAADTLTLGEGSERKATGSYYTPAPLAEQLLAMTLDPLLDRACAAPDPEAALLALRVVDPACGAGHLLLGAAERIAERLVSVRRPHPPAPSPTSRRGGGEGEKPQPSPLSALPSPRSRRGVGGEVVVLTLHGIDRHPVAAELCRLRLARWSADPERALVVTRENIRCGDSVGGDEEVGEGFDGVVGNPPFVNAIKGSLSADERARIRERLPEFGGTADLAYLMLGAALRRARPGGRVGMVLPRGLLNARSAERFRAAPPGGFRPVRVWVPPRADLFPGAAVFVCLVTLAVTDEATCEVCLEADPGRPEGWHRGAVRSSNWWSEAQAIVATGARPGGLAAAADEGAAEARAGVGERFEVAASMTAGDAYDAAPFVVDAPGADGPRLVTTGLIDPGRCLWGERVCRYLKRDLRHPRLVLGTAGTRSLQRRVAASRRPKIIVAGLSKVVECFLDRAGEHIGAVSTYTIYHPRDDVSELEALCQHLLSDAVTERFRVVLGAGALGGGNTTMRKDFLRQLPLP